MTATIFSLITSVISAFVCALLCVAIVTSRRGLSPLNRLISLGLWGTATAVLLWFAWGYWRIINGTLNSQEAGEHVFRQAVPGLFTIIGIHAGYTYTLLIQQQDINAIERKVTALEKAIGGGEDGA